jgi:hypothetical protein
MKIYHLATLISTNWKAKKPYTVILKLLSH